MISIIGTAFLKLNLFLKFFCF